jgi:hypothetical protein
METKKPEEIQLTVTFHFEKKSFDKYQKILGGESVEDRILCLVYNDVAGLTKPIIRKL